MNRLDIEQPRKPVDRKYYSVWHGAITITTRKPFDWEFALGFVLHAGDNRDVISTLTGRFFGCDETCDPHFDRPRVL